jgi:hypothetical protein
MPAFDVRSQRWLVQGIAQLDIGRGLAAGVSGFRFANLDQPCIHTFIFAGIGLGLSARRKAEGAAKASKGLNGLPASLDDGDWDELDCLNYFNGDDLDWSLGQVASAGGALVVGAQLMFITGGTSPFHQPYFRNAAIPGYMLGLGAGASALTGIWYRCATTYG